ncbi:hypothetical protein O4H66_06270 [Comamonadaceae bacterium G21597-S1]|nr:hypothetical protein [Comamonadaceae bacterium G21597-S1]
MSQAAAMEAVRRFHDVLILVSREPVRTAYEVAQRLDIPLSSAYALIAEMERLACLTRDESGYLLTGTRTHQMGLAASGLQVPAQHLAPLVRYLRDHTGETAFTARWTDRLVVGTVATGSSAQHVAVQPFQTFEALAQEPDAASGEVWRIAALDPLAHESTQGKRTPVDLHLLPLKHEPDTPVRQQLLMVVACIATTDSGAREIARRLQEVTRFFMVTQNRRPD